jgi:hypothetical protein
MPEARLVKLAAERQGMSFAEWGRQRLVHLARLDLDKVPSNGNGPEPVRTS